MEKDQNAVALGKKGGRRRSAAKASAARENGQKGGRPASAVVTNWAPFFDALDEVRRTRRFTSLHRMYKRSRKQRERAIISAAVREVATELNVGVPRWAQKPVWLKSPYFVSGVENLKAFAVLESPLNFRMNNIFVLANFLDRV
jgi:hypothetical protein